jgi:hypothetical protein
VPSNLAFRDALQGTEYVLFLAEDDEVFLNSIHEQGLAELKSGDVVVQIGRIFRVGRGNGVRHYYPIRRQMAPNLWALTGGTRLISLNHTEEIRRVPPISAYQLGGGEGSCWPPNEIAKMVPQEL